MSREYEISAATLEDVKTLAALSIEVWLDTYARDGVPGSFAAHVLDTYRPEAFAADLGNPARKILVCRNDTGLLDYVNLNLNAQPVSGTSGRAELQTLYVRRHHHRQGIGLSLLKNALTLAAEAGHPKVFLTVYDQNLTAIAFYEANGMRVEGACNFEFEGGSAPNLIMTLETGT